MGFTFEDSTHTYRLDGRVIPSVSKIMEPLSSAVYGGVNPSVLASAAYRGTVIHEAIENYITFGEEVIDREYAGYFDAFRDWHDKYSPKAILIEERMYHPMLFYAGTLDLVCQIGEDLCLVDYKSSSKAIDKNYRVQLEAYRKMLEYKGYYITKKMVLHLKNIGKYEEHIYPVQDAEAWRVFGSLLNIYSYANNGK